nr:MAG TPA: hypothetical protein [Caudoviricetes sp.]
MIACCSLYLNFAICYFVFVIQKIVVLLQHLTLNKRITRKPTEDILSSVGLSGSCFKFSVRNYLKAEDIFYTACPPIFSSALKAF